MIEGSRFGPYELIKRLGYGGMAEIYLASTRGIGGFEKLLALKVLHARFAQDQDFVDMLIDEAKIAVQLTHVNICQVFDLGCIDERYYIAMEFVDGRDLYQLMVQNADKGVDVPFDIAAFIGREVASGLHYAHTKTDRYRRPMNLIHRDVSPQNVLISFDGQVKLVDFGIAKATARRQQTESGVIKGKFFYMSPEQAWGDELDGRSDVFSCGICLYEMVAGEMLYNEDQPMVLLDRVRNARITPLREKRPDVPRELERIINKALAKDREDRHASAAVLQAELSAFLYGQWPGFGRHTVGDFVQNSFGERGFFLELPEEISTEQKPPPDDDSVMRHDEFERAFEHSVIFALDEGLISENHNFDDENTQGSHLEDTQNGTNKSSEQPAWADEGERTELLDGGIFADLGGLPATADNLSQHEESVDEDTMLFSTPLHAQPARLNKEEQQGPTTPDFDISATSESQLFHPQNIEDDPPAVPRDDMTLNESVPRAILNLESPKDSGVLERAPEDTHLDLKASAPKDLKRPKPSTPKKTAAPLRKTKTGDPFKLKKRGGLGRWLKAPGFYVVLCVLGLLSYAAVRIVPDLFTDAPVSVTLVVESMPSGAKVFIDGEDTGRTTTAEFESLTAGEIKEIRLTLPGHESVTTQVDLKVPTDAHGVVKIYKTVKLVPEKRRLTISSNPPGAVLSIDGVELGETPQELNGIENRIGQLKLHLRKTGFHDLTKTQPWPTETDAQLHFVLDPL